MNTLRYYLLRAFFLTPLVRERRVRHELRKLNLSSEAILFARTISPHS